MELLIFLLTPGGLILILPTVIALAVVLVVFILPALLASAPQRFAQRITFLLCLSPLAIVPGWFFFYWLQHHG